MTQRTVLVINSGSSSIKYQLVDPDSGASLGDILGAALKKSDKK